MWDLAVVWQWLEGGSDLVGGCDWIWSALKGKAALVQVWQATGHHITSHKIQITTSKIIIWVVLLLSSLEFYFIEGTRSQRNVAHWMKRWIFCFQWCISCVFACCLISQNSPFCFRNKYLKYILHWHRWVLLQKNESFFSWHCTRLL